VRWRSIAFASPLFLIWVSSAAGGSVTGTSDACREQLPASLISNVPVAFPGYRAPLEGDNLKEDIQTSKANGASRCLGVAVGDFNGSGRPQYLLGLTSRSGSDGLVVVALRSGQRWKFERLSSWEKYRDRLYVEVARPGTYRRTDALDSSLQTGERYVLHCRHFGAAFGETESTEAVYCLISGKWLYVQTSD
jgi:hypothetical protein